ncbi:hypothetical protein DD763_06755 [Helicobacter pylori]|nr:hypothetical protein DD763_06755 [Helicobacter pylori]
MTQENFKQAVENIENKHQVKLILEASGCKSFYPTCDNDTCKIDAPECEKGWRFCKPRMLSFLVF